MELPYRETLLARAKKSRIIALVITAVIFAWEALTHAFYTWFDESVFKAISGYWPWVSLALSWTVSHPVLLFAYSVAVYCCTLVVWSIWPTGQPKVEITSLWNDDLVDYRTSVHGLVNGTNTSLQVFIHPAGDKRWYPQSEPEINGRRWRARCQFGSTSAPAGGIYEVAAVSGATKAPAPLTELPRDGVVSTIVRVRRSGIPAIDPRPGIHLGRTRYPHVAADWSSYTGLAGQLQVESDVLRFLGTFENGMRYPREDRPLAPVTLLGFRFKADGEVNLYAHLNTTTLLINSRYRDWGIPQGQQEYRVPLPPSTLSKDWHSVFLLLPSIEQHAKRRLDTIYRLSVRGSLWLSHVWCLNRLDELPTLFLSQNLILGPPVD